MSAKDFGKPQPTKTDKLVERVVRYCQKRSPEALDQIFSNSPVDLNKQLATATVTVLQGDIDSLGWSCGYFAGAINRSEDNQKPHYSITLLSKLFIKSGMQPFSDFMPYPGCRIVILNADKFASLPPEVRNTMQQAFDVMENSNEHLQRFNNALLQELVVTLRE